MAEILAIGAIALFCLLLCELDRRMTERRKDPRELDLRGWKRERRNHARRNQAGKFDQQ